MAVEKIEKKSDLSFEEAVAELERCVSEIESPDTLLTDLEKRVKRSKELIKYCKDILREKEESLRAEMNSF